MNFFTKTLRTPLQFSLSFIVILLLFSSFSGLIYFKSFLSILYFFSFGLLLNYFFTKESLLNFAGIFFFNTSLIFLLYCLQYFLIDNYFGFSGGEGFGTDDCRFFYLIKDSVFSLPGHCKALWWHPFADFLKFIYPFNIHHPLQIIFFSALPNTFLIIYSKSLSLQLFNDRAVANTCALLVMICPFLLTNGLILMRDNLASLFFVAGIYYFLDKKIIALIICFTLLSYIRLGSGVLLLIIVVTLLPLFYLRIKSLLGKLLFPLVLFLFSSVIFFFMYEMISTELLKEGITLSSFQRTQFLDFISRDKGGTLSTIQSFPIILRIPLSFIFFYFVPFFDISQILHENMLIPRNILFFVLFPLFNILYISFFIRGVHYILFKQKLKEIIFICVVFIVLLIISNIFLQIRHKSIFMPLYYIVVSYGVYNYKYWGNLFGITFSSVYVVLGIVVSIFGLFL